jgi:hypothetical protein
MAQPSLFVLHDCDKDARTHARACQVADTLRRTHGMRVWTGDARRQAAMCTEMDGYDLVVVFVTQAYMQRVHRDDDYARREFLHAERTKGASRMLVVRFDYTLPKSWVGPVERVLGNVLHVDLVDVEDPRHVKRLAIMARGMFPTLSQRAMRATAQWKQRALRPKALRADALPVVTPSVVPSPLTLPQAIDVPDAGDRMGDELVSPASSNASTSKATSENARQPTCLRDRVAHIVHVLRMPRYEHMGLEMDHAMRTLCLAHDGIPFVEKVRRVERELGIG